MAGKKKKGKGKLKSSNKSVKKSTISSFKGDSDSKITRDILSSNLKIQKIKNEVKKVVVGQDRVLDDLLICLLCEGNVLLEGVPGIAKTLIMKSLSTAIGCDSKRIQFTADLLPTDITGFEAYSRQKGFFVVKGPIFANFVLADEINRAPPKVQSALIEVMQERQVTIGKKTFPLVRPFMVFATENPLENRGVYRLPEAQVDRFLFKIMIEYPTQEEEEQIMDSNVSFHKFEDYKLNPVVGPREIIKMQKLVKHIYVNPKIKKYIASIIKSTRPSKENGYKLVNKYVEWGASPRASINLYLASRANALLSNRAFVTPQDIKDVIHNVLRHRVILNYQGQIDKIKTEDIVNEILKKIKVP
jgi:MoxR-like ATPase